MSTALFTDLYELTMMAGYFAEGRDDDLATFDLYFRTLPAGVDLVIACGLDPALDYLANLRFTGDDIAYLRSLAMFDDRFLATLPNLRFTGDVWAVPEGLPVFGDEPMLRVTAPLREAQLVETALLNHVCYSSLVASNASQLAHAARGKPILEFGARRAHGPNGALTGARAAIVGGCAATSNVEAGRLFDVPVSGTMAHSWIMSFDSELEAFRAYADAFPDHAILLVDTYDTLESGVPNAIRIAEELAARGSMLGGIRLDSGDLAELSVAARKLLDAAGLQAVEILASGDLDPTRVAELEAKGAPIDGFGVGTSLLTARRDPALSGVYKLVEIAGRPVIKISGTPGKTTSPGRKQVWRTADGDVIGLEDEALDGEPLLVPALLGGRRTMEHASLRDLRARSAAATPPVRQRVVTGSWNVSRSARLEALREETIAALRDGVR